MRVIKQLGYGAVVLLLIGFAAIHAIGVNAHLRQSARPPGVFSFSGQVPPRFPGATPRDVGARIMSFDRNHDGKVAKDELLERMQGLMDRDINHDGVLAADEIALQSNDVRRPTIVRGFGGAAYGFDDESEDASRAHVDGALADLRLPRHTYERASTVVNRFLDERARRRSSERQPEMILEARVQLRTAVNQSRTPLGSAKPQTVMPAVTRFHAESRLREAERSELAADLAGILNDEERADFLAAIARRPIKKFGPSFSRTAVSGADQPQPNATVVVRP